MQSFKIFLLMPLLSFLLPLFAGANAPVLTQLIIEKVETTAGFISVGEPNSQGKYSQKLLPLQACIKDQAGLNAVGGLRFSIVAGNATIEKTTDHRGCLQWQELIDFDPESEAKNIMMARTIVAGELNSNSAKLVFSINPILETFKDLTLLNDTFIESADVAISVSFKVVPFSTTSSYITVPNDNKVIYVKVENQLEIPSSRIAQQLEIVTLNLESKGVDLYNVKIDQNLNVIFPHKYYTRFSIQSVKQKLEGIVSKTIKRGNFRFYLVTLKENANLKAPQGGDILSAVEFDATPRGAAGLITVPIVLNFKNATAITNRVNFLLSVVSIDSPTSIENQSFEGFVNGLASGADLKFNLYPSDASALKAYQISVESALQNDRAKISIAKSLTESGLIPVRNPLVKFDLKKTKGVSTPAQIVDLKAVIKLRTAQSLLLDEKRAVCSAYYQERILSIDDVGYQNCLKFPAQHLKASITEFVESVDPNVSSEPLILDLEKLMMTAGFKVGQSEEKKNTNSTSIQLNAQIGGNVYVSNSVEYSSRAALVSSEKILTSLPVMISMKAKTTKCLIISKREDPINGGFTRFYCNPVQEVNFSEYYYLVESVRSEKTYSVIDDYSGVAIPFSMLVRGKETYSFLKEILTNKKSIATLMMSKIDEKKLEGPASYLTQEGPHVLSTRKNIMNQ